MNLVVDVKAALHVCPLEIRSRPIVDWFKLILSLMTNK